MPGKLPNQSYLRIFCICKIQKDEEILSLLLDPKLQNMFQRFKIGDFRTSFREEYS